MAITTQDSVEYAKQVTTPRTKVNAYEIGGKVRKAFFHFTQSGNGDDGSLANLVKLPAGKYRIVAVWINTTALGGSRTMDVGYTAHVNSAGSDVSASEDALVAALDVSSAVDAYQRAGAGAAAIGVDIDTRDELQIQANVEGGTWPDADTLNGWIEYVIA